MSRGGWGTTAVGNPLPVPVDVVVVGRPVASMDVAYAGEQLADLRHHSLRAVRCIRVHLCVNGGDAGRSVATADAVLALDSDVVVCAGAVRTTLRTAIDELASRLRRRLAGDNDTGQSRRPRSSIPVAATVR